MVVCLSLALPTLPVVPAAVAAGGKPRPRAATTASRIVTLARRELGRGVHEIPDGSNRAPAIRRYLTATRGAMVGAPWCAYFVSYVARAAGAPIGPGGAGMGYVPYIRSWAKSSKRWSRTPHAGDLITFPQHVGIVETVYANHTLTTIEGNAGNAVRRRWRRWSEATGYVRVATGGGIAPAPVPAPKQRPAKQPTPVATPLVARITTYPSSTVAPGQTVSFTSNDSSGDIVRSAWDLDGNGTFDASGDNIDRRYTKPGTYEVRLRVTDSAKRTATTSTRVVVRDDKAPVALLDVSSDELTVGDKLTANAGRSYDPDGKIVRYAYDLNGDGDWGADGRRHTFTFEQPGDYDAGLRVTDDAGNVSEAHVAVHVADLPDPVAQVRCDATTVAAGKSVRCRADDAASPVKPTAHDWDTDGDGADDRRGGDVRLTFRKAGERTVRLRVADARGRTAETTVTIVVTNNAPTAKIGGPGAIGLGQTARFDGTASADADGEIALWEWDLDGDGRYESQGPRPAFTYTTPGTYAVRLRITDDDGGMASAATKVTVTNAAPKAVLTFPSRLVAGTDVTFDGSGSSDPDGQIVKWEWDLDGDGQYERTGVRTLVRYATTGRRAVAIRVTDAFGATATASATVSVGR